MLNFISSFVWFGYHFAGIVTLSGAVEALGTPKQPQHPKHNEKYVQIGGPEVPLDTICASVVPLGTICASVGHAWELVGAPKLALRLILRHLKL